MLLVAYFGGGAAVFVFIVADAVYILLAAEMGRVNVIVADDSFRQQRYISLNKLQEIIHYFKVIKV